MKRIMVCTEDETALVKLRGMIGKLFPDRFAVCGYVSARQMMYEIEDGFEDDAYLFFLDLEMREMGGMELAKKLQKKMPAAKIIFFTGCPLRAEEIFDGIYPCGLLFQPFCEARLKRCILKELENEEKGGGFVKINKQGRHYHIPADEILYVESRGRKLLIFKENETEYVYERISNFCLLYKEKFIRCHQSYAINLSHAAEISTKGIRLKNGVIVPVSRKNYQDIQMKIFSGNGGRNENL